MEQRTGCLICGKELTYFPQPVEMECVFCRNTVSTSVQCVDGHFICDACHGSSAMEYITGFCVQSEEENPYSILMQAMDDARIKMHGPEHHFLVPATLLSAYYNTIGEPEKKGEKIPVARNRASKVPGGTCGLWGDCGAAVGTGIFISIVTEATPLSKHEWKLCNLMTSKSLYSMAMQGGPRCCKRNSFIAVKESVKFLNEYFGIELPTERSVRCRYSALNRECKNELCQYFG